MSTLRTNAILDATGGTTATVNGYTPSLSNMAGRNLIINGAMQVAQRGTSVSASSAGYATVDRWRHAIANAGVFTVSQDTTGPDGFSNSLKYECTTADASLAASDYIRLEHRIEAQNLQQLSYGSSGAKQATLSFWVKANKTGTYVCWFYQDDDVRICNATYTVDSSGTWEYKTITIPADSVGVIDNNNGLGLIVGWILAAGTDYTSGSAPTSWQSDVNADRYVGQSVNLADTIGNYWQITGVQLEAGSIATPFERRFYGDELARCQRYFRLSPLGAPLTVNSNNTIMAVSIPFDQPMRATPSVTQSTTTVYGIGLGPSASSDYNSTNSSFDSVNADASGIARIRLTGLGTSPTANAYYSLFTASKFGLDAEL